MAITATLVAIVIAAKLVPPTPPGPRNPPSLPASLGACAVCALMLIASIPVLRRLERRELARLCRLITERGDRPLLDVVKGSIPASSTRPLPSGVLARALAKTGRVGITIAIYPNDDALPAPIDVPFGPVPLCETEPAFYELEEGSPSARPIIQSAGDGIDKFKVQADPLARRARRLVAVLGGWEMASMFTLIFAGCFGLAAYAYYSRPRLPLMLIVLGVVMAAVVVVCDAGAWSRNRQWFLVPGGVISRRSGRRCRDWQFHLYARSSTALLAMVDARSRSMRWVHLADAEQHESRRVTPREARLLLRAWLSPLSPPSIDRLSDLS